jgi:hypothetical protein
VRKLQGRREPIETLRWTLGVAVRVTRVSLVGVHDSIVGSVVQAKVTVMVARPIVYRVLARDPETNDCPQPRH